MGDMASNTPFLQLKTTGYDKHNVEVYIEDFIMQNWFDPSKETEAVRWTKPEKAMACLGASLSPAARAVYKYSLGSSEQDQSKLHMVINAMKEYYGPSIGFSGERHKFLSLLQNEEQSITSCETRICNQATQCEYENFADELTRDQFIAVLISESLCIKRHRTVVKSQDNQKSLYEKSLKYPKAGKFDKEDNPRKLELRHLNSGSFLVLRSASQSSSTTLSSVRKTVQ